MSSKVPIARRLASVLTVIAIPLTFLLVGCAGGSASEGAPTSGGAAPGDSSSIGGGSGSGSGSGTGSSDPGTTPSTPPPPIAPANGPATLRLTSKVGGTAVPFSVGYSFRQGDIPSGKYIAASGEDLRGFQASVKNRWRDGSVKFAILSGSIGLGANAERALEIGPADSDATGAALDLEALKATGVSAAISYGAYGTVTWTNGDWDNPFLSWVSGPEMSSWVYRRAIGADQHLVAWAEVRLYRGGAVEIVPWIENGYLLRPDPGMRSGTATFSINGQVRFTGDITLYNHTRAVLASGQTLSHWVSGDPELSFKHDTSYLQSTGLVPAYRATTSAESSVFARVATSYTPLAQHNFPNGMGAAGFHPSIGPLPEWDVVYLTSDADPRAWRAVQINGYAAGRYGYHFRDEATNRAPLLSSHPNLVLGSGSGISGIGSSSKNQHTPAASGGSGPSFTNSHMPAIGYLPYLMTGRWYFLDEMQLLASAMLFKQNDTSRGFEGGVILANVGANTTRGAAWTLRALAAAAVTTPDADTPLRTALVGNVEANIDFYFQRYVAQANNPLGFVQPYSDYSVGDGKIDSAPWMEDFLTWAFGNLKAVQAHGAAHDDKLDAFLDWKYRSIVGRFGPNSPGNWSYRNAAVYTIPYAPSENPDWSGGTGPWYADWGAVFAAAGLSYGSGTSLLGSYIDDTGLASSYWGNLQPALAYAVEHGAVGAMDAYNRMVNASNWTTAVVQFNAHTPVWSVKPRNSAY